jgi:uncharacterized protein involved in cysteine biosynthesis
MSNAWKFGIVALVALALTALPGGGGALQVVLTMLSIAFFTAIAFVGYRLYIQFGFELESLSDRARFVLYGSVALAFLAFCATNRMFDSGGLGAVAWLALLGICSYGIYWVWTQYRAYS